MPQTLQSVEIRIQQSPESILTDKLLNDVPITKADIEALDLFNDHYIIMLMQDEQTMKYKLAEVLTRQSMTEVRPE